MAWSRLTTWWMAELNSDAAYENVITPLLIDLLNPDTSSLYLDIGCGEGRVMRSITAIGAQVHGVDVNESLARTAGAIVARVPPIPIQSDAFDGVYSVLTLEHIDDVDGFFRESARVTKPAGVLAIVINHPAWTAPESTPITDFDGEVLWRPGDYFSNGWTEIPAGDSTVTFHHRSMAELLTSAAEAGWSLERLVEQPHHELEDQSRIPRLLACRWRLLP